MAYRSADFTPRPPQRAVITGAGILTSHGSGWTVNAEAFRAGLVSLHPVTLFDVSRQRVRTAGQVRLPMDTAAGQSPPDPLLARLSRHDNARLDRGAHLLIHAAHEALESSGLPLTDLPCVLGTSAGAMALGEAFYRQISGVEERAEAMASAFPAASPGSGPGSARPPVSSRRGQAVRAVYYQAWQQAAAMQRALGLTGQTTVISNACASGANAVAHAFSLIRRGTARAVLCGGYDALCQLVFAGFDALKALSPTVARPFDAARDGLALGEGAGLVVMESLEHAAARGAPILAEITGCGTATDLHHLTQPHPRGQAALASMSAACHMAGIRPEQVGYINSHGTGTPLNDIAEAMAIRAWAGDRVAPHIPVSSTKGAVGHLLGGAGAVEAVICLMALRGGFLPPCVNVATPDPACILDLVTTPREAAPQHVLTNSFGFGGSNSTLIFRRWPD